MRKYRLVLRVIDLLIRLPQKIMMISEDAIAKLCPKLAKDDHPDNST